MNISSKSRAIESHSDPEIDLVQFGRVLFRAKRSILALTVLMAITSTGLSFTLPKTFKAEATLLPANAPDPTNAISAGISSQIGAAAGLLGGMGLLNTNRSADLVEILRSRTMASRVIAAGNLDKVLHGWKSKGQLVSQLQEMVTITAPDLKNKLITIQVETSDAALSARITNLYVDELKAVLSEMGYNQAAKNRRFIEAQLDKSKSDLQKAEEKLAKFQAQNRLASLPDTIRTSINTISELESQRINTEVQLSSAGETIALVTEKVNKLQADPSKLVDLEIKRNTLTAQKQSLLSAQRNFQEKLFELPPKAMDLARLQRDVQVNNAVFLALTQQLETALINEARDEDAFYVLDKAEAPDLPIKPNKKAIILVSTLLGFFLACALAIIRAMDLFSHSKPSDPISSNVDT